MAETFHQRGEAMRILERWGLFGIGVVVGMLAGCGGTTNPGEGGLVLPPKEVMAGLTPLGLPRTGLRIGASWQVTHGEEGPGLPDSLVDTTESYAATDFRLTASERDSLDVGVRTLLIDVGPKGTVSQQRGVRFIADSIRLVRVHRMTALRETGEGQAYLWAGLLATRFTLRQQFQDSASLGVGVQAAFPKARVAVQVRHAHADSVDVVVSGANL